MSDCLVENSGARSLQRLVGEWIIYFSCRQSLQLAARRPQFVGSVYDALGNYSIRFLATSVHAAPCSYRFADNNYSIRERCTGLLPSSQTSTPSP